jgi:hypothetical protein
MTHLCAFWKFEVQVQACAGLSMYTLALTVLAHCAGAVWLHQDVEERLQHASAQAKARSQLFYKHVAVRLPHACCIFN